MPSYRFITCNARLQVELDGPQQFNHRVDFLCETLISLAPDIIGFQEVTHIMRKQLIARMPGYGFLGAGRGADRLDEAAVIAYRTEKFMPERLSSEMLSLFPHIPGTTYGGDQSACPRILSSADFMPIDGGRPFRVMNIHTDHIGRVARQLAVTQLLQSLSDQQALRPMPTVITGDFNADPDAPEMQRMAAYPGLTDLTAHLSGTYHDYDRAHRPQKIDYIWATAEWQLRQIDAPHPKRGGLFFSDHDPIVAEVWLG